MGAQVTEARLKTQVLKYLRTIQYLWVYKAADQFQSGIPDLIICHAGKFKTIELKVGKNKLSPIQDYVGKRIEEAGGDFYVCRSLSDVEEAIK